MCITSDKNPSCRRWESKCHAVSSALDQHIELSHTSLQLWTLPSQLTGHPSKSTFLCLLTGSVWKSQLVSYQKAILNVPPMSPAAIVMAISNHIHSFIRSSIHSFVCLRWRTGHYHERDFSRMLWGLFFKLCTNVHCDWLDFWGQR